MLSGLKGSWLKVRRVYLLKVLAPFKKKKAVSLQREIRKDDLTHLEELARHTHCRIQSIKQ